MVDGKRLEVVFDPATETRAGRVARAAGRLGVAVHNPQVMAAVRVQDRGGCWRVRRMTLGAARVARNYLLQRFPGTVVEVVVGGQS